MSLPPPRLFKPFQDKDLIPQIAQIHADCITNDHQLATFLPPLSLPKVIDFWQDKAGRVEKGEIAMIIQMASETEVAGYAYLDMPVSETTPFRSEVKKLMVSPKYRRMGVARSVMGKLEEVAKENGRFLVTLDTTVGTAADSVYPKLGYIAFGVVPKYGYSPKDRTLIDERFYYKHLWDE